MVWENQWPGPLPTQTCIQERRLAHGPAQAAWATVARRPDDAGIAPQHGGGVCFGTQAVQR